MAVELASGEMFIMDEPRCPVHGQMTFAARRWECRGFDGEGCEHTASFAGTARPIGRVNLAEAGFNWTPRVTG